MKRKYYILGTLALLCLLGTGYYVWTLYDAHCKQVAVWNEEAKDAFEEALWMEVNKRAEIPVYYSSTIDGSIVTLKEEIPDSIFVATSMGRKGYKIEKYKYENSLIKERKRRMIVGTLLLENPLSIDTLALYWNKKLLIKKIPVLSQIRYIYTDWNLQNDTVYSDSSNHLGLDSLTVKYLGFRCEHEFTTFISYPYWSFAITRIEGCMLLLPWLLLMLLFISYHKLEVWVQRKMTFEKIIEKTIEVEKEVVVEKEIHIVDVQMDKVGIFQLPDGTVFESLGGTLTKDGVQQRLQPQSISLLKLFLNNQDHLVSSEEICMKLWGDTGYSYRLHSAVSRLRNDLKAVKSELLVSCSCGLYELKLPISSKKSEN